ncbi:hypothetical protein AHF37_09356 [Paragonimus kellicotti]|nr:hypothetical protein AHF37_09356 [Paragonimus kellicotti]
MELVDEARSAFLEARDSIRDGSNSSTLDLLINNGLYPNPPTYLLNCITVGQEQRHKSLEATGEADSQSVRLDLAYKIHYGDDNTRWQLIAGRDLLPGISCCAGLVNAQPTDRPITSRDTGNSLPYVSYPNPPTYLLNRITVGQEQRHKSLEATGEADSQSVRLDLAYKIHYGDDNTRWQLIARPRLAPWYVRELVLIERPSVRRLKSSSIERDCYNCLKRSHNLYPCRGCSERLSLKPREDQVDSAVPRRSQSALSAFSGVDDPPLPDLCNAGLLSVAWLRTLSEEHDVLNL